MTTNDLSESEGLKMNHHFGECSSESITRSNEQGEAVVRPERWLTWDAWMDEQRQRIFAEAAARRTKTEPVRTLAFARTKEPIEQTQLEDKNRRNHAK
jgi:hypothetical protein